MRKFPIFMSDEEHWQYMKENGVLKLFVIKPFYVSLFIVIAIVIFNFLFDLATFGFSYTIKIYTNNFTDQLSRELLLWVIMFLIWAVANIAFWIYFSVKFRNKS